MRYKLLIFLIFYANTSFAGTQTFTTTGTWQVPGGVISMKVECYGGGAGGAVAAAGKGGGGGGGGAYAIKSAYKVTPFITYTVTIGTGG